MQILEKWVGLSRESKNWISLYAWWNENTSTYDLDPPILIVPEDTPPNLTPSNGHIRN
ncbi:hypothetical protein DL96DRAFT_1471479 [Flagelloscypha sp. PMI_526]|nr:hypothetical protein DL96DRAFT_1471479 [Flagelloscypha sp. PMI_526]